MVTDDLVAALEALINKFDTDEKRTLEIAFFMH